jgi:hypothetical protein
MAETKKFTARELASTFYAELRNGAFDSDKRRSNDVKRQDGTYKQQGIGGAVDNAARSLTKKK